MRISLSCAVVFVPPTSRFVRPKLLKQYWGHPDLSDPDLPATGRSWREKETWFPPQETDCHVSTNRRSQDPPAVHVDPGGTVYRHHRAPGAVDPANCLAEGPIDRTRQSRSKDRVDDHCREWLFPAPCKRDLLEPDFPSDGPVSSGITSGVWFCERAQSWCHACGIKPPCQCPTITTVIAGSTDDQRVAVRLLHGVHGQDLMRNGSCCVLHQDHARDAELRHCTMINPARCPRREVPGWPFLAMHGLLTRMPSGLACGFPFMARVP